jgi:hypothetical protein
VVFIVDASGGRLYVDGTLRTTQPWTGTPGATTTTQSLSLAQYPGSASPGLSGRLDDVRIYNRALTSSDVSSLFNVATSLDATPPVVSLVWSLGAPAGIEQVKWTTDEPATSQIEYGRTTAYGSTTALDATLVITHSQTLTGLAPMTMYHYRIRTRDQAGNLTVSRDYTFLRVQ